MSDQPQITLPPMCQTHQSLLVHQAGYSESDPRRELPGLLLARDQRAHDKRISWGDWVAASYRPENLGKAA